MYPTLFRIGNFEITTFGALVALGALAGLWVFSRELKRSRLPAEGVDAALAGVLGGLVGAKLIWAIEFSGQGPFFSLVFSRGGLSWFGGFLGGVGTGLWMLRRQGIRLVPALAAAAPALAIGHAIGRLGCFLVGDDYGRPTDLPWGMAFPKGLPPTEIRVHPTQLYEAAGLGRDCLGTDSMEASGHAEYRRVRQISGARRRPPVSHRVCSHQPPSRRSVDARAAHCAWTRDRWCGHDMERRIYGTRRGVWNAGGSREGRGPERVQRQDVLLLFESV